MKWEPRILILRSSNNNNNNNNNNTTSPIIVELWGRDSKASPRRTFTSDEIEQCIVMEHWQGTAITFVLRDPSVPDCVFRSDPDFFSGNSKHQQRDNAAVQSLNASCPSSFFYYSLLPIKHVAGIVIERNDTSNANNIQLTLERSMSNEKMKQVVQMSKSNPSSPTKAPSPSTLTSGPHPSAEQAHQRVRDDAFRRRLVDFYTQHNPEMIQTVDEKVIKYRGQEEDVLAALENKYRLQMLRLDANRRQEYDRLWLEDDELSRRIDLVAIALNEGIWHDVGPEFVSQLREPHARAQLVESHIATHFQLYETFHRGEIWNEAFGVVFDLRRFLCEMQHYDERSDLEFDFVMFSPQQDLEEQAVLLLERGNRESIENLEFAELDAFKDELVEEIRKQKMNMPRLEHDDYDGDGSMLLSPPRMSDRLAALKRSTAETGAWRKTSDDYVESRGKKIAISSPQQHVEIKSGEDTEPHPMSVQKPTRQQDDDHMQREIEAKQKHEEILQKQRQTFFHQQQLHQFQEYETHSRLTSILLPFKIETQRLRCIGSLLTLIEPMKNTSLSIRSLQQKTSTQNSGGEGNKNNNSNISRILVVSEKASGTLHNYAQVFAEYWKKTTTSSSSSSSRCPSNASRNGDDSRIEEIMQSSDESVLLKREIEVSVMESSLDDMMMLFDDLQELKIKVLELKQDVDGVRVTNGF